MSRNMYNFGEDNEVALVLGMYEDNTLYVGFEKYNEELRSWSPYCDLTINEGTLPYLESAINIDFAGQEKIDFLVQNGFGELTGRAQQSGFIEFPVFKFNAEKLKAVDPEFFAEYTKENGVSLDGRSSLNNKINTARDAVVNAGGRDSVDAIEKDER